MATLKHNKTLTQGQKCSEIKQLSQTTAYRYC